MFGEIKNQQGEILDYTVHESTVTPSKIIVIGHGVTGNKDRPFVQALAEGLAEEGITTLRFSFSGNGNSEGKFTDSTITKEVSDLGSVLDALSNYDVCYVGHSMGGAVGVLRASQDPRIKLLISLAGMVYTKQFAQTEFGEETPDQGCMWEEPSCPLSQAYMDDLTQIDNVLDKASNIKVPWLLLHGPEDDVVPLKDSLDIFEKANEPKKLIQIENANHVFADDATSPMINHVVSWIKTHWN